MTHEICNALVRLGIALQDTFDTLGSSQDGERIIYWSEKELMVNLTNFKISFQNASLLTEAQFLMLKGIASEMKGEMEHDFFEMP